MRSDPWGGTLTCCGACIVVLCVAACSLDLIAFNTPQPIAVSLHQPAWIDGEESDPNKNLDGLVALEGLLVGQALSIRDSTSAAYPGRASVPLFKLAISDFSSRPPPLS